MLYEHRAYYDSYGTGNYTEYERERFSIVITEEKAEQFILLWEAIGCKHYETSKAHFYEKYLGGRYYSQYILYK